MLVLTRKKNESIVINDDITITVVDIRGDKVRLGVEAPKEIPVHRREVHDVLKRYKAEAEQRGLGGKLNEGSSKQYRPNYELGVLFVDNNYEKLEQIRYPL